MPSGHASWEQANQRYLMAALAAVRTRLENSLANRGSAPAPDEASIPMPSTSEFEALEAPPALGRLVRSFGLSDFERSLILLCAGPELDAQFAVLLSSAQANAGHSQPTF